MEKKSKKRSDLINLLLGLGIVVLLNVLSQYAFARVDLTTEKRYTLAESTEEMLENLDDLVYFKVYLEGDFPQGSGDYKRLRDETRIMLEEFRALAGDNIQYEFIDPSENPDEKERTKFYKQLASKGLIPRPETFTDDNGAQVTQYLFPWAVASYHGTEVAVPLMGSNAPKPNEVQLNHAVEGLEYELSNAVRKLQMRVKPKIAILQGHAEADSTELNDLAKGLREYYDVEFVTFNNSITALRDTVQAADQVRNKYDAVLIAGPDSVFTPFELFVLDQFIMYGGKALLLIDPVYTSMDSLALTGMTLGLPRAIGLEELTFRYGARLNTTLVEDLYCAQIAIPVSGPQQRTQFMPAPWHYSPTILPTSGHPIVRNLDRIKFDFLSTVDTVETAPGIKKTVLLTSSDKSRFQRTPVRIGLQMAMVERPQSYFNKPYQPVAVLLEGSFESYFKGKFIPEELRRSKALAFQARSRETKIIVVGDGDVARNPIYKGDPLPLGLDLMNRMNREFYANKTFLLNCMNYLFDDKGLLSVRSREVTLRLLDRGKIKDHRLKWQLINTVGPIAIIILFGVLSFWLRKRRYVQDKIVPKPLIYAVVIVMIVLVEYVLYSISVDKARFWITTGSALAIVLGIWAGNKLLAMFREKRR